MLRDELLDVLSTEGKQAGGYCTSIMDYTAKSGISNHATAGIRDDPCLSKFGALYGLCAQASRQF